MTDYNFFLEKVLHILRFKIFFLKILEKKNYKKSNPWLLIRQKKIPAHERVVRMGSRDVDVSADKECIKVTLHMA
jgi:hypothetical protein